MKIENFLESTYLKTPQEAEISEDQNEQVIISLIEEAIKYKFKLVMIRPDYIDIGRRIIFNKSSSLLLGTVVLFYCFMLYAQTLILVIFFRRF